MNNGFIFRKQTNLIKFQQAVEAGFGQDVPDVQKRLADHTGEGLVQPDPGQVDVQFLVYPLVVCYRAVVHLDHPVFFCSDKKKQFFKFSFSFFTQ